MKVTKPPAMMLLPPAPGCCQQCAVKHAPEQPHNKQSLFYAFWFQNQFGRAPTWADALEHCTLEVRAHWTAELRRAGEEFPDYHLPLPKRGDFVRPAYRDGLYGFKCRVVSVQSPQLIYVRHRYGKVDKPLTRWIPCA